MVYAQPRICSGEWDAQIPLGFWDTNGSPNHGHKPGSYNNQQKRRTCRIADIAIPAEHRVKLNESEKKNKHLDHAMELKKLWDMKVTIILIEIGVHGTVTKGLIQGVEDEWKQHYWDRPEYREESWRLEETCCHLNPRPSANAVKNSHGVK